MTLRETRVLFSSLMALLPAKAKDLGLELAFNEVYRPEEMAKIYKARGVGAYPSAHTNGVAVDVILYEQGRVLTDSDDYFVLGSFWKALHPLCRWGGDFTHKDGNHFSLEFGGLQ